MKKILCSYIANLSIITALLLAFDAEHATAMQQVSFDNQSACDVAVSYTVVLGLQTMVLGPITVASMDNVSGTVPIGATIIKIVIDNTSFTNLPAPGDCISTGLTCPDLLCSTTVYDYYIQ